MLDITVVYEALGHRRASTRAYALLHVPKDQEVSLQTVVDDICAEAKRHGVGMLLPKRLTTMTLGRKSWRQSGTNLIPSG